MEYETSRYRLTGTSPLLIHNGRLSNPMDKAFKAMKEISGKRMKTDADHEELSRREFIGGLYCDEGGPYISSDMVWAMVIAAARKFKKGKQAEAGVYVEGRFPLIYDGPRDADGLWKDGRFVDSRGVKVNGNRVQRTRPVFPEWSVEITVEHLPDQIGKDDLDRFMATAARLVGLGDWRPRFGRFTVERLA